MSEKIDSISECLSEIRDNSNTVIILNIKFFLFNIKNLIKIKDLLSRLVSEFTSQKNYKVSLKKIFKFI